MNELCGAALLNGLAGVVEGNCTRCAQAIEGNSDKATTNNHGHRQRVAAGAMRGVEFFTSRGMANKGLRDREQLNLR